MEQVVRETADMQTTVIEIGVTSGLCLSRNPTLRKFKSVVQAEMGKHAAHPHLAAHAAPLPRPTR